jgi:hypothetical protein
MLNAEIKLKKDLILFLLFPEGNDNDKFHSLHRKRAEYWLSVILRDSRRSVGVNRSNCGLALTLGLSIMALRGELHRISELETAQDSYVAYRTEILELIQNLSANT